MEFTYKISEIPIEELLSENGILSYRPGTRKFFNLKWEAYKHGQRCWLVAYFFLFSLRYYSEKNASVLPISACALVFINILNH